MGCGMVRKVDELGRVVIPKEMRRILNIKTGSSIEMSINEKNQVVLEKFSEMSNVLFFADNLISVVYDELKLPCLLTDDEKVLVVKGVNKNNFLDKKLLENFKTKTKNFYFQEKVFLENQTQTYDGTYIFTITSEGFDNGYLIVFSNEKINDDQLTTISVLTKFLSNLLKY